MYVLDDGHDEYGRVLAAQFDRSAHALGLPVAGTFVSLTGIADAAELGPTGRGFARELSAALGRRDVEPSAIYAAQAMEVTLDAIARSDGTRASVRKALFATDLQDGLIGRVRFDANGDVSRSPVTILRVAPGTRAGPEAPDAVVDRVLRVPANLVR